MSNSSAVELHYRPCTGICKAVPYVGSKQRRICQKCYGSGKELIPWMEWCNMAAMELTQEKRQEFLDTLWDGNTIGEAYRKVGISFEAALGIIDMNIKNVEFLQTETE